jgi:YD repeat-containing protein
MGAYLTSSYAGGIVIGQTNTGVDGSSSYQFSLIDPSGTTHELESDASNWNTYRAADGSGYTFVPQGSYNAYDPFVSNTTPCLVNGLNNLWPSWFNCTNQDWIGTPTATSGPTGGGLRLGTLYSPTGITYSSTIKSYISTMSTGQSKAYEDGYYAYYVPQAITTTVQDPSKNTVTRGPWYWSGYYSVSNPLKDIQSIYTTTQVPSIHTQLPFDAPGPYFTDSVGRLIPDVISMQAAMYAYGASGSTSSGTFSLPWNIPGPGNTQMTYTINYSQTGNQIYWNNTNGQDYWVSQGLSAPDPSTDIDVSGFAITSIVLPNGNKWTFTYANTTNSTYSAGDLIKVTTPTGGTISYTYTSIYDKSPVNYARCNGVCHAVASRTESDGISTPAKTYYTYNTITTLPNSSQQPSTLNCAEVTYRYDSPILYAYSTTVTDPMGNDTVHSYCPIGVSNATPVANQYREVQTDYYEGCPSVDEEQGCLSQSGTKLLKTVAISYTPQLDILTPNVDEQVGNINTIPTLITTTTPYGLTTVSTTEWRQYSTLFQANKVTCGGTTGKCTAYSTPTNNSEAWTIPINYLSPKSDSIYYGLPTTTTPTVTFPGPTLRSTSTQYMFEALQNNPPNPPTGYTNTMLVALPLSTLTFASGNQASQTTYNYDTGGLGNLVSVGQWLNTTRQYVTTQSLYNSNGMPYQTQDANGNFTYVSGFMDQCSNGAATYSQQATKAYGSTTTVPETSSYNYDCNTNALIDVTDPNNVRTHYTYTDSSGKLTDSLGRLTEVDYGYVGTTGFLSKATLKYTGMTEVDITHDQTTLGDNVIKSSTVFDDLGRTIQQTNPDTNSVCTTYNANGQVATVSNPINVCPASSSNTIIYNYDPFGRVINETEQDGSSILWSCYNGIQDLFNPQGDSVCSSNTMDYYLSDQYVVSRVDSVDEVGNDHQQYSNALGQLIITVEPNSNFTYYGYDGLGNLSSVRQTVNAGDSPRIRTFTYDSLSRLLWSKNPETGVVCYGHGDGTIAGCNSDGYDSNGNLLYKTDARGVTTSFTYDALNRLLSKTASDSTPSTCYVYDTATNGIGRLSYEWTQMGSCAQQTTAPPANALTATQVLAYDVMGRITSEQQCVFTNCTTPFTLGYSYDLMGNPTMTSLGSLTGVQALSFTNTFDTANRLKTLSSKWSDTQHPATIFSSPSYGPSGGLTAATYGAGLTLSRSYDNRLRVIGEIDTGSGASVPTPGSATVTISGAERTH